MDREQLKQLLIKRIEAYRILAETESGKLIMEDLASVCHVNRTGFVPGDPSYTHWNEGKRWVWLYIQTRLKAAQSPAELAALMDEMFAQEEEEF